jgi:predicted dienelactone hydrolase
MWKDRRHLDPSRIGIFGFSAGATTALISVGGKPDLRRIASHCAEHPEFVCKLTSAPAYRDLSAPSWQADGRIKAAVIAAPGLGFTFEPDGLADVRVPLQLWAGSKDQTVPYATNAGLIRRLLRVAPEVHVVPGAVHYSFLMPCGLIGPPEICRDSKGLDRASFHHHFNRSIVAFFRARLAGP